MELSAFLVILVCVVVPVNSKIPESVTVKFWNILPAYGDISDQSFKDELAIRCEPCLGGVPTTFTHPKACNLYFECLYIFSLKTIYIIPHQCGYGTFYDEQLKHCLNYQGSSAYCQRDPCAPGNDYMRFPKNDRECGPYLVCDNGQLETRKCDSGFGYDAYRESCSITCEGVRRDLQRKVCSDANSVLNPGERNMTHFNITEYVRYIYPEAIGQEVAEITVVPCPPGTLHLNQTGCACEPVTVTAKPCTTTVVARLQSGTDDWYDARHNNTHFPYSAIGGNASLVDNIDEFFPMGSARFLPKTTFSVFGITGNDLGLYVNFTFSFLPVRAVRDIDGNWTLGEAGIDLPIDNIPHTDFALADNSYCGIEPTFGCKLNLTTRNRGRVVCYVMPLRGNGAGTTATSQELNLNRRINVEFVKDNARGYLEVTEEFGPTYRQDVSFPEFDRAQGNSCPLNLFSGTSKRYTTGYMDNLELVKHCGSFLP